MLSILLENIVRKLKKHKWIDNILFMLILLYSLYYISGLIVRIIPENILLISLLVISYSIAGALIIYMTVKGVIKLAVKIGEK